MWKAEDYKLCLVLGDWAYFTTQDLDEQWGDDWNDSPYWCNAGEPYIGDGWDILKVGFEANLVTPEYGNEYVSVETMNRQCRPWLYDKYGGSGVMINAGTNLVQFVQLIKKLENGMRSGEVYLSERAFEILKASR